jgi:hypothetical protein
VFLGAHWSRVNSGERSGSRAAISGVLGICASTRNYESLRARRAAALRPVWEGEAVRRRASASASRFRPNCFEGRGLMGPRGIYVRASARAADIASTIAGRRNVIETDRGRPQRQGHSVRARRGRVDRTPGEAYRVGWQPPPQARLRSNQWDAIDAAERSAVQRHAC